MSGAGWATPDTSEEESTVMIRHPIVARFLQLLVTLTAATTWSPATFAQSADYIIQELGGTSRTFLSADVQQALDDLEAEAKAEVIAFHQLPDDAQQAQRLLDWGRGELRSQIYQRLVQIAQSDTRTDEEQTLAEAFAEEWHRYHLHTLELAKSEYLKWKADPCGYVPPEGFEYDPDPTHTLCTGNFTLVQLLTTVEPPSLAEFEGYGQVLAGLQLKNAGPALAAGTFAQGMQLVAAVAAAEGVAAAVSATLVATANIIFPFVGAGITTGVATGITLVETLAAIGAAPFIGPVLIVLLGVIIGVLQGFNVFDAASIGDNLDQALADAQTRPPLVQVLAEDQGREEFFNAILLSTLPDFASEGDAPAPSATDDWFVVTDPDGNNPVSEDSIGYIGWLSQTRPPTVWSLRLSHGWFASETQLVEPDAGIDQAVSALTLGIQYLGWRRDAGGNPNQTEQRTAWRVGKEFFILPKDGDPETDGYFSDTLQFWEPDGSAVPKIATIAGDNTPPVVTPTLTGTLGTNDWYTSPVTLEWDIQDPDSDISFTSGGCATTVFSADSQHLAFCTATSHGGTTNASVAFKIDQVAPTITGTASPDPNGAGWNNTDVTVHFECTDPFPGSGVAPENCGPDSVRGTDTPGIGVVGSAKDEAGNISYYSVGPIMIDQTPPTIVGSPSPAANANGWNNGTVTVSFTCSDALSGVQSCSDPASLDGEGSGQSVSGTAMDVAGNSKSTTTGNINIDLTPPTISGLASPAANAYGWNNSAVTVSFTCNDALSGVQSCADPATLESEGSGQSASGTAMDLAGNSNSTSTGNINIDLTPPTISGLASPAANAYGWNNGPVTVSFSCNDALSGVLDCTGPVTLAGEGTGQSASGSVTDQAGNSNTATVSGIQIDLTPPVVTITTPAAGKPEYLLNEPVQADWSVSDALSGFSSASGTSASRSPVDTSVAGEHEFVVQAFDIAGNLAEVTHDYVVLSPADSIGDIEDTIAALVDSRVLKPKQAKGLLGPLDNAIRSYGKDKIDATCSQLDDFVAGVNAKTPNPIDQQTADELVQAAEEIATVSLNCP